MDQFLTPEASWKLAGGASHRKSTKKMIVPRTGHRNAWKNFAGTTHSGDPPGRIATKSPRPVACATG